MLYKEISQPKVKCTAMNDTIGKWEPQYRECFSLYPHIVSSGISIGKYYVVSHITEEDIAKYNVNPVKYDSRFECWKVSEKDMILLKLGLDFK